MRIHGQMRGSTAMTKGASSPSPGLSCSSVSTSRNGRCRLVAAGRSEAAQESELIETVYGLGYRFRER